MMNLWVATAGLLGFATVALAALASHVLPRVLDAHGQTMVRSALEMGVLHVPALLAAGIWAEQRGRLAQIAAGGMLAGLLLFWSGIAASVLQMPPLGILAPLGGTVLMLAWLVLAVSAIRR